MNHIAILKKTWKLLPKIISVEKTIESRWYQTRRDPWNKIKKGDIVYFNNSGELVTVYSKVKEVKQFIIKDYIEAQKIVDKYGKDICLLNKDVKTWENCPKYCILVFLGKPNIIRKPFKINKKGYGISSAWLVVKNIKDITM